MLSPAHLSPPLFALQCNVPCASLIRLIVVFTPPTCLLLHLSQARPFIAICPGPCHLSPCHQVATSCCAIAIASNSKSPLVCPGWLSCDIFSRQPLDAPPPLDAPAGCCVVYSSPDTASHCLVDMLPPLVAGWLSCDLLSRPCPLTRQHLLMRQLDVVLPLVAVRPSRLPRLVVVASPLVALHLPPNVAACNCGIVHVCVNAAAEESRAGEGGGV